jgi:hypothetical protein
VLLKLRNEDEDSKLRLKKRKRGNEKSKENRYGPRMPHATIKLGGVRSRVAVFAVTV